MIRAGGYDPARTRALSHPSNHEHASTRIHTSPRRTALVPRAHHPLPTLHAGLLEPLTLPPPLILQKHGERIRTELTRVDERVLGPARRRRMRANEVAHGYVSGCADPSGVRREGIGVEGVRFGDAAGFFGGFGGGGRGGAGVVPGGFFPLGGDGAFTFRSAARGGSRGGVARGVRCLQGVRPDMLAFFPPTSCSTLGRHRLRTASGRRSASGNEVGGRCAEGSEESTLTGEQRVGCRGILELVEWAVHAMQGGKQASKEGRKAHEDRRRIGDREAGDCLLCGLWAVGWMG